MSMKTPRKTVLLTRPAHGVEIVTLPLPDGRYETTIHQPGGMLDGERFTGARTRADALGQHEGAELMVAAG